VKLLLDTHTFLWFVTADPKLSATAQSLIADMNNEVFVSPASYWEVAIKVSLGKYPMTVPFETFFQRGIEDSAIAILAIQLRHAAVLSSLAMHHKDPFDRMIISQAIAEQFDIVGSDVAFDQYPIKRIW
jgi:PIN domain nuclease of toxin-antitoxin system